MGGVWSPTTSSELEMARDEERGVTERIVVYGRGTATTVQTTWEVWIN